MQKQQASQYTVGLYTTDLMVFKTLLRLSEISE